MLPDATDGIVKGQGYYKERSVRLQVNSAANRPAVVGLAGVLGLAGLEPATGGLENRCSILLSYSPKVFYFKSLRYDIVVRTVPFDTCETAESGFAIRTRLTMHTATHASRSCCPAQISA